MIATTTARIYRGLAGEKLVDAYGDTVDIPRDAAHLVYRLPVPIAITEATRREWNPQDLQWRTVRWLRGRVRLNVGVEKGDVVVDVRTGTVYNVDGIARVGRTTRVGELSFELRAANAP